MAIEWWIVVATLVGPVIAVQTQKWIERATENRRRRLWIFHTLMANRATRLADEYVRALNLIDLEFRPRRFGRAGDRTVVNAWRALFGELQHGIQDGDPEAKRIAWNQRCDDRLVELLLAMSKALGYSFSQEELRRGIYHPQGHAEREVMILTILSRLRSILEGKESLPMKITEAPVAAPEVVKFQAQLTERMATAYGDDGALKVRIQNGS